jgi:hypothetical protein
MDKTASRVSDERLAELLDEHKAATDHMRAHPGPLQKKANEWLSVLTELQSIRSLSSDSVSDGSKGVRVKPLEWNKEFGYAARAESPFGVYAITDFAGFDDRYRLDRPNEGQRLCFEDIDQAKAAAQADYEQRILSTLDSGTGGQQGNQPAAYLLCHETGEAKLSMHAISDGDRSYGWEQTPLYPSPTEPKAGVVSDDMVDRAAKRICLATGLDWDSIDDAGPDDHSNNSGDETKGWFRYLAAAALNGVKP